MSNQENDVRRDEFGSRLRAPSFVNTVGAIKLEKEIELPSSIMPSMRTWQGNLTTGHLQNISKAL